MAASYHVYVNSYIYEGGGQIVIFMFFWSPALAIRDRRLKLSAKLRLDNIYMQKLENPESAVRFRRKAGKTVQKWPFFSEKSRFCVVLPHF